MKLRHILMLFAGLIILASSVNAQPIVEILNPQNGSTVISESISLKVNTNEEAVCYYELCGGSGNGGWCGREKEMSLTGGTYHRDIITDLQNTGDDGFYRVDLTCQNGNGEGEQSSRFYVDLKLYLAKPFMPLESCGILNQEGVAYRLMNDLYSNDTCFTILGDNIELNLNGYTIEGNGRGFGIRAEDSDYLIIRDGTIKNFEMVIQLTLDSSHSLIDSITGINTEYGIDLNGGEGHIVGNNNLQSNRFGLFMSRIKDSYIEENIIIGNEDGIRCSNCINVNIEENTITNNTDWAIFISGDSHLNTIDSNIVTHNGDGIILTSGPTNNVISNNEIGFNVYGLDHVGIGLYHDSLNNEIIGNEIFSQERGIWIWADSHSNSITENTLRLNQQPLLIHDSKYNRVFGNWFLDNEYSLSFGSRVINNLIYNNYFKNYHDPYLVSSGVNLFNIGRTNGKNIIGGQVLGGNYWANPYGTGFSETCSDGDKDGFCDDIKNLGGDNIDYLPLSKFQLQTFIPKSP